MICIAYQHIYSSKNACVGYDVHVIRAKARI